MNMFPGRLCRFASTAALAAGLMSSGTCAQTRQSAYWPFSANSPWNTPINSGASFAPFAVTTPWAAYNLYLNWQSNTVNIVIPTQQDPVLKLYDNKFVQFPPPHNTIMGTWQYNNSIWYRLYAPPAPEQGGPQSWCQPVTGSDISGFLGNSVYPTVKKPIFPFPYNPWSTLPPGANPNPPTTDYSSTMHFPVDTCGSPDGDGLTSVIQPGAGQRYAVDLYAPIVLPENTILIAHGIGSYYDLQGDGTGVWNGRRASMIPTIAGVIRTGEIANGLIPHALAALIGNDMLTKIGGPAGPAVAYDQQGGDRYANCAGCLQMGALLAIPSSIDLGAYTWHTAAGLTVAKAAQTYGIYIVDTGSYIARKSHQAGIMNLLAELNDPDIGAACSGGKTRRCLDDLVTIKSLLAVVSNSTAAHPGGPGKPAFATRPPPPFGAP